MQSRQERSGSRTSSNPKDIGWAAFPYKRTPIMIHPDTFNIYRCGSVSPQNLTNPTFFSEASIAEIYRGFDGPDKPRRPLYRCLLSHGNDKPIRLMDIRILRHWFVEEMLQYVQSKTPGPPPYRIADIGNPLTPCTVGSVLATLFATGILSFPNQLRYIQGSPGLKSFFLQENKTNYYKQVLQTNFVSEDYLNGFRASSLPDDTKCVQLYKNIFGEVLDGYICPQMYSPWHASVRGERDRVRDIETVVIENDKFHQEMVLFDPSKTIRVTAVNPEGPAPSKTEYAGGGVKDQTTRKQPNNPKSKILLNHHSAPDTVIAESFKKLKEETMKDAGYQDFVKTIRAKIRSEWVDCDNVPTPIHSGSRTLKKTLSKRTN